MVRSIADATTDARARNDADALVRPPDPPDYSINKEVLLLGVLGTACRRTAKIKNHAENGWTL